MKSLSHIEPAPYTYDQNKVVELFTDIIKKRSAPEAWEWLEQNVPRGTDNKIFNSLFVQLPRKTGRTIIQVNEEEATQLNAILPLFSITNWPLDRLCRVWLLLHLATADRPCYITAIDNLFITAEMNEQVALYSALPLLAYPEYWRMRCAEGIRSNIGDVLEAIMYCNPYPSLYLDEAAWNQMVLKAFFTEKKVHEIIGLDERSNGELANILTDYAHERWAARRSVNPQLWRCIGRFTNQSNLGDLKRVFNSQNETEREAAALALNDAGYAPAKSLLSENPTLKTAVETGRLTWNTLAQKTSNFL